MEDMWILDNLISNIESLNWDEKLYIEKFYNTEKVKNIDKKMEDGLDFLFDLRKKEIIKEYFSENNDKNNINYSQQNYSFKSLISHLKFSLDEFDENDTNFYKFDSKKFYYQKINFIGLYWLLDSITKYIVFWYNHNYFENEYYKINFQNIEKIYKKKKFTFFNKGNSQLFKYLIKLSSLDIFKNHLKEFRNDLVHDFKSPVDKYSLNFPYKILFLFIFTLITFIEFFKNSEMVEVAINDKTLP